MRAEEFFTVFGSFNSTPQFYLRYLVLFFPSDSDYKTKGIVKIFQEPCTEQYGAAKQQYDQCTGKIQKIDQILLKILLKMYGNSCIWMIL